MAETSPVSHLHQPEFDRVRSAAHGFVVWNLRMRPAPIDNFAIISDDKLGDIPESHKPMTAGGRFDVRTRTGIIVDNRTDVASLSRRTGLASKVVHEMAHSASIHRHDNLFNIEALAGMAEYKFLERLRTERAVNPAGAVTLERAGVELLIPGAFRYTHPTEDGDRKKGQPSGTSNGLIAALGVAYTLRASGMKSSEILHASSFGGTEQYGMLRDSADALRPGLAKEIDSFERSTDGIIQATAMIQQEAAKKDLV